MKKIGSVLRWVLTVFAFVMVVGAGALEGPMSALLVLVAALLLAPPVSDFLGRAVPALRSGWITLAIGLIVLITTLVLPHPVRIIKVAMPAASRYGG